MSKLLLENHKAYLVKDNGKRKKVDSLSFCLGSYVEIGENFLFKDLWKFLLRDEKIMNLVFYQQMGGFPLKTYKKPVKKKAEKPEDSDPIFCLEVNWNAEIWQYTKGNTEMYLTPHFCGWNEKRDVSYSMGFTHVQEMMDLPLKISEKVSIYVHKCKDGYKSEIIDGGNTGMTLFDFLGAILDEITFYGNPDDKDKMLGELNETMKRIESGEEKLIPIDDLKEKYGK